MEEMEKLENLEFRVFLEGLVPWAPLEIRDQWEIREQKDLLEFLDPLAQEETLEKMVLLVFLGPLDKLAQQEREVWLDLLAQEVSKECPDHLARMARLAGMVLQECKVPLV